MKDDQQLILFYYNMFLYFMLQQLQHYMHCGSLVFVDVNRKNVSFNPVFLHPLNAHARI